MKHTLSAILLISLLGIQQLSAEYSSWTLFGGLNLIYNSDGEGVTTVPGMQDDGNPGGLSSAPSPLAAFFGGEYRYTVMPGMLFAPSASLYAVQYLWAKERPLPAEIEFRTAYVPSILIDLPLLYHIQRNRMSYTVGGGPGILLRYAFLEPGVPAETQNPDETLNAGEQVDAINAWFWQELHWFYPVIQAGLRYELETGWGAGFSLRTGLPLFNAWDSSDVPFYDSIMVMLSLTITPPRAGFSQSSIE